ncbi:MAG: hypothetical protein GXP49_10355 [Deltaproteobacteria bacterium]|nr:hypothetical protein [Deltaproteobacteria bacterium]
MLRWRENRLAGARSMLLATAVVMLVSAMPGKANAQWTELGIPEFSDQSNWRNLGNETFKYGHKPQVLILLDNSLAMNRRPWHQQWNNVWFHSPQEIVSGGPPNNRYGPDRVPTLFHIVIQALLGDYQDPPSGDPWRMRYPDDSAIGDPATLLGGGRFNGFDQLANFTQPVLPEVSPNTAFFPICRMAVAGACAGAPNWLNKPMIRRATIYSGGNGRRGFYDYNQNNDAVRIDDNGLLRWKETANGNNFGSQIRFGLMLLDNDPGDWNDFPLRAWGFTDGRGDYGADAYLSVPFASLYTKDGERNYVVPRTCASFDTANCQRSEKETNDLIIATLLDAAETASGQNVQGTPPNTGRRTRKDFRNNLAGRAPLSALLRDAQIMIDLSDVNDPFKTCRQTYILLITGSAPSLEECGNYDCSSTVISRLAAGLNAEGTGPLQGFGLHVKTFVVALNTEDRLDTLLRGQAGANATLTAMHTAGDTSSIEHENTDVTKYYTATYNANYIRVDLEHGTTDVAGQEGWNDRQMVQQVRDAIRERVFRPILEHQVLARHQPPAVVRARAPEGPLVDPLYYIVDPVFRIGQTASAGAGVDVQAKTPWRLEMKRRRVRLTFDAVNNREYFAPIDGPTVSTWELFSLPKARPIYSAFPPNWNLVDITQPANFNRLREIMELPRNAEVQKVVNRLKCPRPSEAGIGIMPAGGDCLPGEVLHSEVVIARPPRGAGDDAWQTFVEDYAGDPDGRDATMAFVATGDGQVHAFVVDDAVTAHSGTWTRRALWSYVPYSVLKNLRYLPGMSGIWTDQALEGKDYYTQINPVTLQPMKVPLLEGKHFYVDATPVVKDLYFPGLDEYRRVLAGGTRGGRSYWALDITNATKLQNNQPPGFIGEYSPRLASGAANVPFDEKITGKTDRFENLGITWSKPLLGHLFLTIGGARDGKIPIMAFPGGYAPEDTPGEIGQYFYIVDLNTRDLIWRDKVDGLCRCGSVGCPATKCSFTRESLTGEPVALGSGTFSSIKEIWFGNSEGRLFKLVARNGLWDPAGPQEKYIRADPANTQPAWQYWQIPDGQNDFWDQYQGTGWQVSREPIVVAPALVRDIDGSVILVVTTGNPDDISDMGTPTGPLPANRRGRQEWVFALRNTYSPTVSPSSANETILRSKMTGEMASPYDAGCDPDEYCTTGCCASRLLLGPNKKVTGTPAVVFGQVYFTANEPVVGGAPGFGCMEWLRYLYGVNILNMHAGTLVGGNTAIISTGLPGTGGVAKVVVPEEAPNQILTPSFGEIGLNSVLSSGTSGSRKLKQPKKPRCRYESWGGLL